MVSLDWIFSFLWLIFTFHGKWKIHKSGDALYSNKKIKKSSWNCLERIIRKHVFIEFLKEFLELLRSISQASQERLLLARVRPLADRLGQVRLEVLSQGPDHHLIVLSRTIVNTSKNLCLRNYIISFYLFSKDYLKGLFLKHVYKVFIYLFTVNFVKTWSKSITRYISNLGRMLNSSIFGE